MNKTLRIAGVILLPVIAIFSITLATGRASTNQIKSDLSTLYSESYTAELTSDQVVPAASSTMATGTALFNVAQNGETITYTVTAQGVASTSLELACADRGSHGPLIATLDSSGSGTLIQSSIVATAAQCSPNIQTLAHLVQAMREGKVYVSLMHDGSSILRGQLMRSDNLLPINGEQTTGTSTIGTSTPGTGTGSSTATSTTGTNPTHSGIYYVFVEPDQYYKNSGGMVTFTGSHFVPGEYVTISHNGTTLGMVTASSNGMFVTNNMMIPYISGTQTYTFKGASSQIPYSVGISVDKPSPWITLSSYYAPAGSTIAISGHGFGSGENVTVTFGSTSMIVQADGGGNFMISMPVPAGIGGQSMVTATGASTGSQTSQNFSQAF